MGIRTLSQKSVDIRRRVDHDENMNDALTPPMTRPLPYGLTHNELEFEPLTIEQATDLDLQQCLHQMAHDPDINDPTRNLILDAALALYEKQCHSPTYDFTDRPSLFAACLHSATIWHFG